MRTRAPSAVQSSHEKESLETYRDQNLRIVARIERMMVTVAAAIRDIGSIMQRIRKA